MKFNNSCDGCYADSLDVRFTKACDNHCPFCIERQGICAKQIDVESMIDSTIKSGKRNILILGGEPLLEMEQVFRYIMGIRGYVDKIYLTTSLPYTIIEKWDLFEQIVLFLDGLNVSLQHYSSKINNEVLHASSNHDRIALLQKMCKNDMISRKTRVSINLVKGYIDSKLEIDRFLSMMEMIGVRHVKINELQGSEDLYVSFEKSYGKRLQSPYSHGCQTEIELPNHNIRITLKRSCFCVNNELTASIGDVVKAFIKMLLKQKKGALPKPHQMVVYENGLLSDGWMKLEEENYVH